MKHLFLPFFLCLLGTFALGQNHNMHQVGQLSYTDQLANIWGYVHPDGTEYALVGTYDGTSIVSLANPANPVEVAFVNGTNSIWRELRTWGDRAYVVADATSDGLLIIDLSNLPTSVTHQFYRPSWTVNGDFDTLKSVHTIHIDEQGYGYLMGSNFNHGETIIIDVASNPTAPVFLGATNGVYAHDSYTRNDRLYTSDIYAGTMSIHDISNRNAPVFLASKQTPFAFTHNAWLSDNSQFLFTTDEKANAYVASYDVSDPLNITELDRFRVFETEGTGVIPHNAHVKDDYVFVSYYTDGVVVLDGSNPYNLVQVGRYDTYTIDTLTGFRGAWGVYPYLPSGLILVSDMQTGLHVLGTNLNRACWVEGLVTEQGTGTLLSGVQVRLVNTPIYDQSNLAGEYKTGTVNNGNYTVRFIKAGYQVKDTMVTLVSGQILQLDVELEPAPTFAFAGTVKDAITGNGIPAARVRIKSSLYDATAVTNASGDFSISIYADEYAITVGAWGWQTQQFNAQVLVPGMQPEYTLNKGYRDEFALNMGWSVLADAATGNWERSTPSGSVIDNNGFNLVPPADVPHDIGTECYVTGNADNGTPGADDVDNGFTTLVSPVFDLSGYTDPYVNFYYWWMNTGGAGAANDSLVVELDNGSQTVLVDFYRTLGFVWRLRSYRVSDHITPTSTMRIRFRTGDSPITGGHIVEAGIDDFSVTDGTGLSGSMPLEEDSARLLVFPNPFRQGFTVDYAGATSGDRLRLYNALGQSISHQAVEAGQGRVFMEIGDLPAGTYWLQLGNTVRAVVRE